MFTATYGGKTYDETHVQLIELKQARIALDLLKSKNCKPDEIFTKEQLDATDDFIQDLIAKSNGEWKSIDVRIHIDDMTMDEYLDNFYDAVKNPRKMLGATPDHMCYMSHLIEGETEWTNNVIEFAAGMPSDMLVRFSDDFMNEYAGAARHEEYPKRIVGKIYDRTNRMMGGVHHEFRDAEDGGVDMIWGIFYPAAVDEESLDIHREHTLVECYGWYRYGMERMGRRGDAMMPQGLVEGL
ncbi:MAG: hypothetical protein LUD71_01580 [Clostridiales bacterium]|nr:hypothetical protein [Clostridiales bacterium]